MLRGRQSCNLRLSSKPYRFGPDPRIASPLALLLRLYALESSREFSREHADRATPNALNVNARITRLRIPSQHDLKHRHVCRPVAESAAHFGAGPLRRQRQHRQTSVRRRSNKGFEQRVAV
eukprot:2765982-Prymnesium_polylepis.1